jgi:hypothetical protein
LQCSEFAEQSRSARGKKKKKKGGSEIARLPFCEDLIKATTCNLLLPPCDGDGTQRYRKPCKAFALALQLGCNWTINVGDLSFAEPPDCFELPIRAYSEAEYLDAAEIGAAGGEDSTSRADDVLKIATLLEEEGHREHAAFMHLQVLRYRSDDPVAHLRTFALGELKRSWNPRLSAVACFRSRDYDLRTHAPARRAREPLVRIQKLACTSFTAHINARTRARAHTHSKSHGA